MTFSSPLTEADNARKAAFAAEFLRSPDDPYSAARRIFPLESEKGKCVFIAAHWPNDPEVKTEQARLIEEHGAEFYLPNKIETAKALWDFFKDDKEQGKDRLAAAKLFTEVMGFVSPKGNAPTGAGGAGKVEEPELPLEPAYKIVTQ